MKDLNVAADVTIESRIRSGVVRWRLPFLTRLAASTIAAGAAPGRARVRETA